MRHLVTAFVFLVVTVQLQAVFAQSITYDVDFSGTGTEQGLHLRVFGSLTVDLMTDQVEDSDLQFQIDGNTANDLILIFNNDDGTGIVDFIDTNGELFVIAETNQMGTIGPLWQTLDEHSYFEIFSGFAPEVGGVVLGTSASGNDFIQFDTPSPLGFRLGLVAVPELGDVNLDGAVNFLDISPFISVLSTGGSQAEADIDQSGMVDFLDISPFIAILSSQ